MDNMPRRRAVRIAGASGSASDRRHAFSSLAVAHPSDPIDVLTGDWMSEANMTSLTSKAALVSSSSSPSNEVAYEKTFLEALSPALHDIARYNIRVAVNAGASDVPGLARAVEQLISEKARDSKNGSRRLKVAWISGDEVLPVILKRLSSSANHAKVTFSNLCTGEPLSDWQFKTSILGAQAYLGGMGIALAFQHGADIVIAGRVADASPVIGAAAWWHGWGREQFDLLAAAFVAGHLIECSNYVCGGNWSGFKELEMMGGEKGWLDIGYPIAEIGSKGELIITKQKETGGIVSTETCKAQLLYEIQGPWYFNSDVTAVLDGVSFEQLGTDRVAVHGVKALPPPPTTKVGITAHGGFQAEVHWFLVGLNIREKARMMEAQIRNALGDISRFHVLKFTLNGTAAENPSNQNSATVAFRVFAQAKKVNDIVPDKFLRPIIDLIMCGYPGATFHLDFRQGIPKPVQEYFVTLLSQQDICHEVHLHDGKTMEIEPPKVTKTFPRLQPSQNDASLVARGYGETIRGPLGWLVHARSGDKGSNANVGLWVRYEDEYDWMRTLLSVETMKELLADEYSGNKIDRFELPNIWAVHFLLYDHLDRGVSCSSTYDFLGKNVAEFLRSRHVDLPKRFLNRGKL